MELSSGKDLKISSTSDLGTSLLTQLPSPRTCSMANIPMGWCSCTEGVVKVSPVDIKHIMVAALKDMDFYLNPLGICNQLLLRNITDSLIRRENGRTMIEAKVTVLPHNAGFLVRVFLDQKSWNTSSASFIRLDRYSLTSNCVPEILKKVKPYCICMEHTNKL